jgi:hypothetical protein
MALTKTIAQLPTELLSSIFSHVDDQESIRESRLVSHRFHDASTPFLTRDVTVCMRSESLAALEVLSNDPIYSKFISSVSIVISFFDSNMAAERALYMRDCESKLYQHLEIFERSGMWRTYRREQERTRDEIADEKEREEIEARLWEVSNSNDIGNISADGFDEASATSFQKLFLRLHAMYKERCSDQEQVRRGNEHITRICAALRKLPKVTEIQLKDNPYLVSEQLQESDFADLGFTRNYLRHFDSAVSPSQFCGSFTTAYSVRPPLEMVGELA